jgi:glutathione S-transferase
VSYKVFLGNKAYSSWSLRGWLLFEAFGIPFHEEVVPLFTPAFERLRQEASPARTVPMLRVEGEAEPLVMWDSLAIAEFLHERHPDASIWPADPVARAAARSLAAEMHAGFGELRSTMPMNLKRRYTSFQPNTEAMADIERATVLWRWAKSRWGADGPYLFGEDFTASDAFFVPVASRFRTYGVGLDALCAAYAEALLAHPATRRFTEDANAEDWVIEAVELEID